MGNGKLTWTPAGSPPQEYIFPVGALFASKGSLTDKNDRSRAIDGTMRTYNFTLKKSYVIAFKDIPVEQAAQFRAIKEAQVDISFYENGINLTLTGQWVGGFSFAETSPGLWAGGIQLEEI
jgi:hypothetical protein